MRDINSVWLSYHSPDSGWEDYPDGSMCSFLQSTAERYPNYTAIEFEGKKMSFSLLIRQIDRCAAAFEAAGIGKSDFVSIVTPNLPSALVCVYALNRIGAIANILHPLLSAAELQSFIEAVNSKAVVTLDQIYPKFAKMQWKNGLDPQFILLRVIDELPFYAKPFVLKDRPKLTFSSGHRVLYWREFLDGSAGQPLPEDDGKADDVAVILYSGGTTGTPKGVEITNGNMNCLAVQSHDVYERDDIAGTHSLALMPIFHGFGLGVCMHGMLCNALHVFLVPKYDMRACTKLIFKRKISFLFGVPALYEAISRSEEIEKKDLSFIKFLVTAGDRTPLKLQEKLNRQLERGGSSAKMREAYGQTECTSGCCINPFFKLKPGSIGIPYTDMRMKIVRVGTEEDIPNGNKGEICISGPTVMKGYLNQPEETAKTLRRHMDGRIWLHTGDIGWRDDEGYYFFSHREGRMIITSGYNVYPSEVEKVILQCKSIAACAVIGRPDRVVGQRVCLFAVSANMGADPAVLKTQITEFCSQNLSAYSVPTEIVLLEELPVTSLGKVDYAALEKL